MTITLAFFTRVGGRVLVAELRRLADQLEAEQASGERAIDVMRERAEQVDREVDAIDLVG